ncbi:MAG: NADPH:quinone oxidoreductase family protein [Myxococcota bacterium]
MTTGQRVMVRQWGETPLQTLKDHVNLQTMARPTSLEPDEILLRVRSCAVGWVDLIMMSGQYQHQVQPPYTPGIEFAGEVAAIGAAVTDHRVGDRVLADGFRTGPRSDGPHQRWGGFATWSVLRADAAFPLPDTLSFDQAVNLLGNYETAYHVLRARGQLQPGETVIVLGASGSTGLAGVRLAKQLGATVIAVGRTQTKLDRVAELGADHVLTPGEGERWLRDAVRDITGGQGADVVWDGVGGPISIHALRALRFGGRFCIVGWAATPFVARGKGQRGAPNANQLPTNLVQMKGIDVLGCPAVIATLHDPSLRPHRLAWIWDQVRNGTLRPHAGPGYALGDFNDALRAKWSSQHVGGCVLHP